MSADNQQLTTDNCAVRPRLKVLISAYACEPGKGSEPAVGWNLALQAQRFADVYVVTRANNRPAIEAYEKEYGKSGVRWVYYDVPRRLSFWKKGGRGVYLYYLLWQAGIIPVCRKLHRTVKFDLAHHLTFGSLLMPTFIYRLKIQYIWGPVGGVLLFHPGLFRNFSLKGRIIEFCRFVLIRSGLVRILQHRVIKNAAMILTVSGESRKLLGKTAACCEVFSQVGISEDDLKILCGIPAQGSSGRTVLMAGRLLHWKGFGTGIRAFGRYAAQHPECRLVVLGSGGDEAFLRKLTARHAPGCRVEFVQHVDRNRYFEFLAEASVLLFPSSHEPGAYVIVEMMAAGRPVICTAYGEPAALLSPESGLRVDVSSGRNAVDAFSNALTALLGDPEAMKAAGAAGRKRVLESFVWDQKGLQLRKLYEQCATRKIAERTGKAGTC